MADKGRLSRRQNAPYLFYLEFNQMAGVVANNGELVGLKYLIGELATTERLRIKLYQNDVTPSGSNSAGDFTEASFIGYVNQLLSTWTITPGEVPKAQHTEITFEASADQPAQNIYGYYIVRTTTGDLILARRFVGAPYSIQVLGDAIAVTPILSAKDAS
jgi:hypothetical protein